MFLENYDRIGNFFLTSLILITITFFDCYINDWIFNELFSFIPLFLNHCCELIRFMQCFKQHHTHTQITPQDHSKAIKLKLSYISYNCV